MISQDTGSWNEWESIWKRSKRSYSGLSNVLFTRDAPKNIYQFWHKGYANDLLSLISPNKHGRFIELGSGRGTTSMYLADKGFNNITLVDLSKEGLKQAEENFEFFNLPKPKIHIGDVRDTGLESERFDCIYNIGLLEHFEEPVPVLKEAKRLLKKGGILFMPVVPRYSFWRGWRMRVLLNPFSILKHFLKQILNIREKRNVQMVRTENNEEQYENYLKEAGFNTISVLPYNPYWKVNKDGSWWETNITLPFYRWHYRTFSESKKISMQSKSGRNVCVYLFAIND